MMTSYKSWTLCLLSACGLAIAQPLYMPSLFGSAGSYQWLFGLLALVAYVPLWWVLASKNLKTTFLMSFVTLTVSYSIVLYWIYIACHDYGDISPLSSLAITLLLPMEIAFVGALFLTWGRLISLRFSWSYFWIAPIALTAMEYFRNYLPFGGFPWGNSGYAIGRIPQFLQFASVVGVYGLVFFVGVINSLICFACKASTERSRAINLSVAGLLVFGVFSFGVWRLHDTTNEFGPKVRIALLQGNIAQDMKNRPRTFASEILAIYRELHAQAIAQGAELVVWPEAAHPKIFEKNTSDLHLRPEEQVASVIGATTFGYDEDDSSHYHNSAFLLSHEAKVLSRYDKSHLVPFGEYVPWPFVGIVGKIVPNLGAYRPGNGLEPVVVSLSRDRRLAIGTTVCYEGIFPEISRAYAKNQAALLVNVTNDAWYGESSAPYQHLLMYQLRSVETGLPYARATNSGISAYIDAYGRILKQSSLFKREILVEDMTLVSKATIYTQIGDLVAILCSLTLVLLSCILIYRFALRIKPSHLKIR